MKHVVITRFDYPSNHPHLERRIELFHQYTLPSMRNQLYKDFIWCLVTKLPLSDLGVDSMPIQKIENYQEGYDIGKGEEKFIITRIDNDDALHTAYIANIQFYAEKLDVGHFIDFSGYCYKIKTDGLWESNKYVRTVSPFVSSIEDGTKPIKGVYRDKHANLSKHGHVFKSEKRMWMQIIHDTNVSNKVNGIGAKLDHIQKKEVWSLFK